MQAHGDGYGRQKDTLNLNGTHEKHYIVQLVLTLQTDGAFQIQRKECGVSKYSYDT